MKGPTARQEGSDGGGGPAEEFSRETLMRYLDGELAPDERRRVEEAVRASTELQRELAVYRMFHQDLSELRLGGAGAGRRSVWSSVRRRLGRPAGWIVLGVGVGAWIVHVVWVYLTSAAPPWEKAATSAIVIGILILLASVIVERWEEWQTDPYRDVER